MKAWIDKATDEILREIGRPARSVSQDIIRDIIAKHHERITKPEPGHIHDWAAKVGVYLHTEGVRLSSHRIAAVVAFYAEPLMAVLRESKRIHYHDREWNCCPRCTCESWPADPEEDYEPMPNGGEPCNCGADEWNAKIDEVLNG